MNTFLEFLNCSQLFMFPKEYQESISDSSHKASAWDLAKSYAFNLKVDFVGEMSRDTEI